MKALQPDISQHWLDGYSHKPFTVATTSREFQYSKRAATAACTASERLGGCNLAAVCTPHFNEVLVKGGGLRSCKQFDARGASTTCRKRLWAAAAKVAVSIGVASIVEALNKPKYADVKADGLLASRRRVKSDARAHVLRGWIENSGDDDFAL
jgi:tRNA-specific adenosine deaminase 1